MSGHVQSSQRRSLVVSGPVQGPPACMSVPQRTTTKAFAGSCLGRERRQPPLQGAVLRWLSHSPHFIWNICLLSSAASTRCSFQWLSPSPCGHPLQSVPRSISLKALPCRHVLRRASATLRLDLGQLLCCCRGFACAVVLTTAAWPWLLRGRSLWNSPTREREDLQAHAVLMQPCPGYEGQRLPRDFEKVRVFLVVFWGVLSKTKVTWTLQSLLACSPAHEHAHPRSRWRLNKHSVRAARITHLCCDDVRSW